MHPLERRVAKLEPHRTRDGAEYAGATERLLERMDRIRERMSSVVIDEKSLSLAEIMAGAPCGEATKQRLWDFLTEKGISQPIIQALQSSFPDRGQHASESSRGRANDAERKT